MSAVNAHQKEKMPSAMPYKNDRAILNCYLNFWCTVSNHFLLLYNHQVVSSCSSKWEHLIPRQAKDGKKKKTLDMWKAPHWPKYQMKQ